MLPLRILEEHTQHANLANKYIGIFKNAIAGDLCRTGCPLKLWAFAASWRIKVQKFTANPRLKLEGLNPYYHTVGTEDDISNLCVFGFFSFVMYQDKTQKFPEDKWWLGICLGPSNNYGNEMTQWILGPSCVPVPRRTVRSLTDDENKLQHICQWKLDLLQSIYKKFGLVFL